jgi:hypothetical protein
MSDAPRLFSASYVETRPRFLAPCHQDYVALNKISFKQHNKRKVSRTAR